MELKKAQYPSHRIQLSLSLGLLLGLSQFSSPVKADDFLCDAVQSSNKDLPKLESTCPIGKGLWGKKLPPKGSEFYWIQCGLLPKPMTVAQSKPLYIKITTDVWMKPEKNGYRCLIGPYLDAGQAVTDLREVKTLPDYKEAFIRVVGESNARQVKPNPPKAKAVSPKPTTPASAVTPAADVISVPAKKAQTKSAVTQATTKPSTKSESKPLVKGNNAITVRLTASVQDKTYVVPYLVENRNQFYMEHGTPWNRLNYDDASQICHQLGMSLVTHDEFKALRSSGVMEKNRWPLQLPYWGKDKIGLFADRIPNQLTGTSLLNVLCVK
ncbi:hypothetical protein ACOMICROBIO_FLGHMIGD_00045 [Vibrio sp. B1FLJ16]|uniref:SPOR domain-containing protein n=1 Tax=Vibrio sp. B1FLJ16 TaxID=2751178 RepID=UPI0015F4B162|nr:SPOR domain-containing protein [Vibrio sp. B1FLJ16]CAD7796652.1 hypothetical protein ACOMICROBIO_FLGHMIGD_00045 [Vibrio sp. B1FLJ16]CAE6877986.1 hypothetical protein ACOMICROBIO_FLGHMIGD_00045 [Vibrio sp. B1FLJ16]